MIFLVSGQHALNTQAEWLPILERAIDKSDGRWTVDEFLEDVAEGNVLVWIVTRDDKIRGVLTTRLLKSPRTTWVLIEDCAGEKIETWLWDTHSKLEAWARELGATQIMFEGRRGWERMLRGLGYETRRIQAVKHLRIYQ